MITILSLVSSVKDYVEIVHKLIETDSNFKITNYSEIGPIISYSLIVLKDFFFNIISLNWLKIVWDLPVIIPDINSAMISEISVLDGYLHNTFNFLDKPISYGETNTFIYSFEKFSIGLINSLFLCIPTGTSHLITLRRFVIQGLDAGYIAGLGSICGNILWIGSVVLGCRFFVIPWLSLDIFRYILGFILLIKYMWESYNEKKIDITTNSAKQKIFLLNFLLALTEQTSVYPFISNLSIGSDSSLFESFPANNYLEFYSIHGAYILGLGIGCLSLLHFTCWFWENPAFKIYMWAISSFKISTNFYYKTLNFTFLYLTMICAISNIPYYGIDYTLTNPLGFVQDDRILDQKLILETSFLNSKASDRNTRRNRGRHGRRERWKRRIRKYRTFDASLYDQGIYDLFTIEDLNYGFDRFWLRRKMRNHRVRFRFFPGPWMRSFKKQLAKPRLESYDGPRQEFFRILFEQVYHPSFHQYNLPTNNIGNGSKTNQKNNKTLNKQESILDNKENIQKIKKENVSISAINNPNLSLLPKKEYSMYLNLSSIKTKLEEPSKNLNQEKKNFLTNNSQSSLSISNLLSSGSSNEKMISENIINFHPKENLKIENSTLRKFIRKVNSRIKSSELKFNFKNSNISKKPELLVDSTNLKDYQKKNELYSKRWKQIFSKLSHNTEKFTPGSQSNEALSIQGQLKGLFKNFYQNSFNDSNFNIKKENSKLNLSTQDKQVLKYRSLLMNKESINETDKLSNNSIGTLQKRTINNLNKELSSKNVSFSLLHPLKFYLKKQEAFERKLKYYTPTIFRKFSIENNAPYFRIMMKRYFYYFKPTLRWERTMKVASLRKARRKTPASPKKIQFTDNNLANLTKTINNNSIEIRSFSEQSNLAVQTELKNSLNVEDYPNNYKMTPSERNVKATHNYTIVGKRANRFRYEIYKDVLQHWYYSPFNRLLLKFDIDLFIKRQPNSHFLTKNEENLLHLRRFLLSEHYNTLRWYSYMQHYRSMKTKIGGTKSFASKTYNQQFSGTFKKIRHLFAITPSQSNQSILKFDQPLYNETFNNSIGNSSNNLQNSLIIHEELLNEQLPITTNVGTFNDNSAKGFSKITQDLTNLMGSTSENLPPIVQGVNKELPLDLLNQSTLIIGNYLKNTNSLKQEYIKNLLDKKDYTTLTQFLYKGKKTRGLKPITNEKNLLDQEKNYLLTDIEKNELKSLEKIKLNKILRPFQQNLWVNLLKKWKRKINDQEFLKNYLQRRVEKREKRKQKKEKNLKTKLERLDSWLSFERPYVKDLGKTFKKQEQIAYQEPVGSVPTLEGLEKNNSLTPSLGNMNKSLDKQFKQSEDLTTTGLNNAFMDGLLTLNNLENNHILSLQKIKTMSFLRKEKDLKNSLEKLNILINELDQQGFSLGKEEPSANSRLKLKNKYKQSLKNLNLRTISLKIKEIYTYYKKNSLKFVQTKLKHIFKPIISKRKNLKNWQKKERSLNRQKRSRKEFKVFSKKPFQTNNLDYLKYLDTKTDLPLNLSQQIVDSSSLERKKRDFSTEINKNNDQVSKNNTILKSEDGSNRTTLSNIIKQTYQNYFSKKFKRKKTPQRRARIRRNRGVTKKRTLSDSLKREFKNLRRYGEKTDDKKQKIFLSFNSLLNQEINTEKTFKQTPLQRRSKQKKQRFWKQKRSKFSQKSRKYKKRRRSVLGKVRILNKQLKRIKSTTELKNWWWKNFIPNLRATTDSLLQFEKDRQIKQKLLELSIPEIIERDQFNNLSNGLFKEQSLQNNLNSLQIGDYDYKPLAMPEALKLRKNYESSQIFSDTIKNFNKNISDTTTLSKDKFNEISRGDDFKPKLTIQNPTNLTIDKSLEQLATSNNIITKFQSPVSNFSLNTVPFYAGWDESLRKFVVTNRLLSRRESGYEITTRMLFDTNNTSNIENNNQTIFSEAPLKGMNAATTLYWQIPFTTYDPDQFFALGMDGFAPLGWRRFQFRHSILKSWLYEKISADKSNSSIALNKNIITGTLNNKSVSKNKYIVKNKTNIIEGTGIQNITGILNQGSGLVNKGFQSKYSGTSQTLNNIFMDKKFTKLSNKNGNIKNIYRRLKKRYKRVKKHPRSPVWFPSGPLLNQVLPVHYIYIFYKRSRLPRDRYIKRRLKKISIERDGSSTDKKEQNTISIERQKEMSSYGLTDFTLRKRIKTKRKYHIKKESTKKNPLIPRRKKFIERPISKAFGTQTDISNTDLSSITSPIVLRWRPLSRQKINKPIAELIKEQRALKYKQRKKDEAAKQSGNNKQTTNLRTKQLRRRVQRQIIRSVWRYKPRAGGFVWPGDYLKLEQIKAPKLNLITQDRTLNFSDSLTEINPKISSQKGSIKVKKKKKRSIQEWQIQPKKYLLEKHNSKAIKKRLEKANRSNKIEQRMKELNLVI